MLVRPDAFVAWRGTGDPDRVLPDVLARCAGLTPAGTAAGSGR